MQKKLKNADTSEFTKKTKKQKVISLEQNFFQFCKTNNVFQIFVETDECKEKTKQKIDRFGIKYLKSHVHWVISKMVVLHQLDIKF